MFEMHWVDPVEAETVGDRHLRQGTQNNENKVPSTHSGRVSMSTASSSSTHSSDKAFSLFKGISFKKTFSLAKPRSSDETTISQGQVSRDTCESSIPAPVPSLTGEEDISVASTDSSKSQHDATSDTIIVSPPTQPVIPPQDLALPKFIKQTDITSPAFAVPARTRDAKSRVTQTLGPSSAITQTTRVVVGPHTPQQDGNGVVSTIMASRNIGAATPSISNGFKVNSHRTRMPTAGAKSHSDLRSPTFPLARQSQRAPTPKASKQWQPPEAWQSRLSSVNSPSSIEDLVSYSAAQSPQDMSLDLSSMQREIKRMAAAGSQLVLSRLTEEWGSSTDASLYKELEMERTRWMLSALYNRCLDEVTTSTRPTEPPQARKVLAFFETNAMTSYVAAVHCEVPVYHMAPAPLSHHLFPNVKPIISPTIPQTTLSVAPNFFDVVYCLRLPSLLPSSEIPQMLRNIGKTLTAEGVLEMMLIDPAPVASSTGPHLRKWLQENLLFNLERQFRCMSPVQLMPIWLQETKMRGPRTSFSQFTFKAVHATDDETTPAENSSGHSRKTEEEVKNLLRTEVGRLLWVEVWGKYATAKRWWWEDPECVAECQKLGTFWECKKVSAAKQET